MSDRVGAGAVGSLEERTRQALFLYGQDYRGETATFHLLANQPHPQLLGYLSRKIDIASHYMWQFGSSPDFSPDSSPDSSLDSSPDSSPDSSNAPSDEELSRLLEPVYRYEDELLGRLLAAAGHDINVVILSDHGFRWESDGWGHEETAPPGIFLAMGPAFKKSQRLASVRLYDIAPTVLHLLHMPVGKDMAGEVLVDALADNRPSRWIESYDGVVDHRRPDAESPFEERVLEELKALGYLR